MLSAKGTDGGNAALLIGTPMRSVLVLAILWISGCTADTMRGYIGQDIRSVELANGPPSNQIDLGQGTRAFQWITISADTTPVSAVTTTDKDNKGRKVTQ